MWRMCQHVLRLPAIGGKRPLCVESTYCLGCGAACVKVCPEHALKLVEHDASIWSSSIPKPRKRPPRRRRLTKKLEKVKAEAKAKLDKMLDQVEKLRGLAKRVVNDGRWDRYCFAGEKIAVE